MKTLFLRPRILFAAGAALLIGIVFTACKKSDYNNNTNTPVSDLMAFNLAPGRSVSISLSGNMLGNSPLPFNSYTGSYLSIYPGTRSVDAYDNGSASTMATQSYDFAANRFYSVFVVGANGNFRNVIVNDNFDSLSATSGQAYVRYINAIPDSSQPAVTITANGSNVSNSNAAFASVSDFTAVTPGPVSITVNNGSTINLNRTITLEQQKAYTVLLSGVPGSAAGSDSLQIKYITNGMLTDSASHRAVSSGRPTNNN